jgi:hypothetical protein
MKRKQLIVQSYYIVNTHWFKQKHMLSISCVINIRVMVLSLNIDFVIYPVEVKYSKCQVPLVEGELNPHVKGALNVN